MSNYQDTYGPKIASLTVTVGDDPCKHRVDTSKLWKATASISACYPKNQLKSQWPNLRQTVKGDWDCPECLALYPLTVDDDDEEGDDSKDYIWE